MCKLGVNFKCKSSESTVHLQCEFNMELPSNCLTVPFNKLHNSKKVSHMIYVTLLCSRTNQWHRPSIDKHRQASNGNLRECRGKNESSRIDKKLPVLSCRFRNLNLEVLSFRLKSLDFIERLLSTKAFQVSSKSHIFGPKTSEYATHYFDFKILEHRSL